MRILIAEDDAVSRRLLQSHLEKWGHEVVVTKNGAEAWALFEAGDFFFVITDWMMPEVDGVELIRRIRSRPDKGYPFIILLTARSETEDIVVGLEAGGDDFVTKPFDHNELRVRVRAGERIIELKQALAEQNRQLREAQSALIQSEKLASLGQLAAGVAHEVNNPLAYVTNNVTVLQSDMQAAMGLLEAYRRSRDHLPPQIAAATARQEQEMDLAFIQENYLRQFEKSLEGLTRVRDIVLNLRDFARLDEAEVKEAEINAAILSAVEIIRHEMKTKSIRFETDFGALPPVLCHPGKINQVFLNLLVNAVQACAAGGTVQVHTHSEPAGEGRAPGVVIEVRDDGIGIPPENLPRIFDPFFTTKPVGQGTGLGLSVSYGIIRDHGGGIEAESGGIEAESGHGTTFRVRLPLQPPPKASAVEEGEEMEERGARR